MSGMLFGALIGACATYLIIKNKGTIKRELEEVSEKVKDGVHDSGHKAKEKAEEFGERAKEKAMHTMKQLMKKPTKPLLLLITKPEFKQSHQQEKPIKKVWEKNPKNSE